jgi:ketosteroid isomerase-like protein
MQPPPEVDHVRFFGDEDLWRASFAIFADRFQPDFESTGILLGNRMTFHGSDGCRALLMHWYEPWATYRAETHEAIDLGEQVLVSHEAFGRLEGSSAEVKLTGASLYAISDGKVARIEFFLDRDSALKAVGLAAEEGEDRGPRPSSRAQGARARAS